MVEIVRRYKSLPLTSEDLEALRHAHHVLLQSLFEKGKRSRGLITIFSETGEKTWLLTTGADITFLSSRLKEPRVECHCIITNVCYNVVWTTLVGSMKLKDELELCWFPDSHTTRKMLENGLHGDAIRVVCHRSGTLEKQFHHLLSVIVADCEEDRSVRLLTKSPTVAELNYGLDSEQAA